MKASKTIPRSGTQDHCTNYQWLLTQGLQYCQDLGGDLWTDFNQHDPGVTILQQLCYAITDLSYRTDFSIADIMAAPPHACPPDQPLYTGDRILTSNPVTAADYEQLLYDRIDGVKNSWLVPIDNHPQGVRGLYEVQVETREDIDSSNKARMESIRQQVEQWMRSTRNLAEDVERVTILTPQPIGVEAVVEIRPQSNPVSVLAQVLFKIQNSLIPFPRVQLVDELFQRLQPDQIWNGPPLSRALDKANLQPLKRAVDAQEIVNIILQVPGVKQVKHLRVSSPPDAPSDSPIPIRPGCVPRLDPPILQPQESYTISIELEGGVKWQVDSKAVWARIQELEAQMRNSIAYAARSSQAISYRHLPAGTYKAVEDYFSIQHQFPVVYGLSKYGIADTLVEGTLSPTRTPAWDPQAYKPQTHLALHSKTERQARVQQLKAYLLFFEQLLANYLSQLAHVGDLFSLDDRLRQSYFYQPLAHHPPRPSDPQKITDLLVQQPASAARSLSHYLVCVADPSGRIVFVSNRIEKRPQAEELRSQLIESGQHRHNYRFRKTSENEYQLILHTAAGNFLAAGQERFATAEAARTAAERWAGFMAGLVGIKQLLDRLVKIYRREDLGLQVIDENSRIVLTSTGIRSREEVDRRIEEIIAFGADPRAYRFAEVARGGFRVQLQNDRRQVIAEGEETFETEFDAEEGVDRLTGLIARMAHDDSLRETRIRRLPQVEEIGKNPLRVYQDNLARLERQHDNNYLKRRNDVLNHLLARFGERFDDDILEQLDLRPFGEKDDFYHERIRWKIEFLRCYIDAGPTTTDGEAQGANPGAAQPPGQSRHGEELGLGSGRGQGFDYGATDKSNPVSGLERRLSLLLGIQGHMQGRDYHRMGKEGPSESGFYYVEKQVEKTGMERVEGEKGGQYIVPRHRILGAWRAGEPDLQDLHHNFVFSSEDSGILRHLLTAGTNRENYVLHPARDGYHVLFQSPSSREGMEIHRAGSREKAEQAIESLIRYLLQLNQSAPQSYAGERLWLVEHVLLRPRGKQQHSPVRISHKTGIHLSSAPLHKDLKPEYLELVLRHGQHHENYRIQTDRFGDVIVVLYHEQEPIAYTNALESEREAAAAIPLLAELVVSISQDHAVRKQHVHMEAPDTFYSHRLSVFLPNWPLRFQSNEFKLYAEQMIKENCPAHLAVNCFWLSAHDEKAFEQMYGDWKLNLAAFAGKGAPDARQVDALDEASERLKVFIEKLQREQERWAASSEGKP